MAVPLEKIEQAYEEYRRACESYRDESASPEARKAAGEDMIAKRHLLDELQIEDKREREEEDRTAMLEARRSVQRLLGHVETGEVRKGMLPVERIREFAGNRDLGRCSFEVVPSLPHELRTEYDVTTTDTNTYAKYLIPQTWADYVVTSEIAQSGVLAAGPTIVRTANGGQMNFPYLSTDIAAAAGTEGSDATQDTPVFGTVAFNSLRIDGYIVLTEEVLRDSGIDLNQYLGNLAGRTLGAKMAAYLGDVDTGTGSSLPACIAHGATSALTAASKTAVTVDELKQLYYSVYPQYRRNGAWIANSAETLRLAQAKDDNGQYYWQPSVMAAAPEMFMGKPWFEDAYFDSSESGNFPVVFGDVAAAYIVRLIGAIDIAFSREVNFKSFEVVMRYGQWFWADTVDASAVKKITLA